MSMFRALRDELARRVEEIGGLDTDKASEISERVLSGISHTYGGQSYYIPCGTTRDRSNDPAIVAMIQSGIDRSAVCKHYGVSRATSYRIQHR